ncbi:MAG: hypothetical protein GY705_18455, partial [Bacteroidetes bacterium]|nr:hypothetical protein [Bacteroidota bacterium]
MLTNENVRKLLAVSTGGLGDTVLFSPVFKALRSRYPNAAIELLAASNIVVDAYTPAKEINRIIRVDLDRYPAALKIIPLLGFIIGTKISGNYDIGVFASGLNPKMALLL